MADTIHAIELETGSVEGNEIYETSIGAIEIELTPGTPNSEFPLMESESGGSTVIVIED